MSPLGLGCNELHEFPRIESARVVLGVVFATKKISKIVVWGELAPQNLMVFNPSEMIFSIKLRYRRYAIPTVIELLITKIITKKMC